jgi:CubicO group peptidase (beta-lactamase class C family)
VTRTSFSRRDLLRHALLWPAATFTTLQAATDIDPRERAAMARLAEDFRGRHAVPALSVAIAFRGRVLYEQAFGMADSDRGERALPSHRFRIASLSKPITSCAIMDLVESGRLTLDRRVFGRGGVLGTDYGHPPYKPYVEDITIEHLLTHTGGGWPNDGTDPMFRHPAMNRTELISWTLDSLPLASAPGRSYAYSNFGYCLLGRVIEIVTGTTYDDHVRSRILSRCGVHTMAIAGNTLQERLPDEARYYGQGGENPYVLDVRRMDSHGGWIATPRDLVTFVTHVDGLTTPNILRSDTIARMVTPSAANSSYAKGWSVNRQNTWWHSGSLAGTQTVLVRTANGFAWAALTNTRSPRSDMGMALDGLMWEMARQVTDWGALR